MILVLSIGLLVSATWGRPAGGRFFHKNIRLGPITEQKQRVLVSRCTSQGNLAAYEALRETLSNKLLSVLVKARHPIMYSPEAREAFQELPHLYFGLRKENPQFATGSSHQWESTPQLETIQLFFKYAPSGTTPVSKYFHNSINNFLARATIPIRLTRLLPSAKRRLYQQLKALSGW